MPGKRLSVIIVDDEPPARRKIRRFLRSHPQIDIVAEAGSGEQAVSLIRKHAPDLLFLDVQMSGLDGFGVLEALGPSAAPETIFITAHDQHALQAFEVNAIDYLLKPFDQARFDQALLRARHRLRAGRRGLEARIEELLERIERTPLPCRLMVKTAERTFFVDPSQLLWIEAASNYVCLHLPGTTHLIRESLDGILRQLDPEQFVRVHRSTIVNLEQVAEFQPWSHGDSLILLKNGKRLRLSRRYRDRLPDRIRRYL